MKETFPQNRTSAQYVAPRSNAGEQALVSLAHAPDTRQLQFFDAKTRTYAPSAHQGDLSPDNARSVACGRAWRIAAVSRPLKPKYNAPRSTARSRSIADVQGDYLRWAQAKGLARVTAFSDRPPNPRLFAGEITYVDAAAYFAVTEETVDL